jgi:hypothetical protein
MQTQKANQILGKRRREEPGAEKAGIFTIIEEEPPEAPALKIQRRRPRTAEESSKRNAVLWDSPHTLMLVQGAGENGGPSTQSDPLPVEATPSLVMEVEEGEESDQL